MIYSLGDRIPEFRGEDYFVADNATVIGSVVLENNASIWFNAVLRGDNDLITATLTIDTKPIPGVENFVVRWDNRIEVASEDVYANGDATDVTDTWFSSTIGVVGYADLL